MALSSVLFLFVCIAISLFSDISAVSRHQQELKEHYEHLAKIAEFECGTPQPRLMFVQDLFSEFQTHGKAYFPEVTVLHRCDRHVGSCNDGSYWCGSVGTSNISMPFKVTFLEDMDGHKKGEWVMEYHPLENHTSCGCLKAPAKPPTTIMHYHYIDPSLMPSPTQVEQNHTIPSIYDMTQIAEEEVSKNYGKSGTEPQVYPENPSSEPSTINEVEDSPTTPLIPLSTDNSPYDSYFGEGYSK